MLSSIGILDACIILFILMGAIVGFKRGVIKSVASFLCFFAAIILAYYIKNPLSVFMYTNFPFMSFNGIFEGVSVLNILIYEMISYVVVITIIWAILSVVLKLTGIIEKLLKMTVILAIPSKILGFIFGAVESLLYILIIVFILSQITTTSFLVKESKLANTILDSTPVVSNILNETVKSTNEIMDVIKEYEDNDNKDEVNYKALDILLKNKVITTDNAKKLVDLDKLKINNANDLIKKYESEN